VEPWLGQERPQISQGQPRKREILNFTRARGQDRQEPEALRPACPGPAPAEVAKAGATRGHRPGAPMGITPPWPTPRAAGSEGEPAQHSSNRRQRTRPTRGR
jgi:hypothetical protein